MATFFIGVIAFSDITPPPSVTETVGETGTFTVAGSAVPITLVVDDDDDEFDDDEPKQHFDYIYEPNSEEILNELMMRYIESQVYQATVENVACEMSARMIAMKSATDNAGDLIDELQLIYNKARQAAITQEISEIVAGASAV